MESITPSMTISHADNDAYGTDRLGEIKKDRLMLSRTSTGLPMSRTTTLKDETYPQHPNTWSMLRSRIREPLAEFLGTMILIIFGTGVSCQVGLSSNNAVTAKDFGSYLCIPIGWGIGVALGTWVAGSISGAHLNPAVTLALTIFRRFPLRKLPVYALAQIAGAFFGSLIVYGNYWRAIELFEQGSRTVPGTASLFATYPLPYLSAASCFFSEFLGTAMLLLAVLSVNDKKNAVPKAMVPLALLLTIVAIGVSLGMQTGYALNPARDLGPRLMTLMFYGREVFNYRSQYWLWTPILGPVLGAIAGTAVYDLLVYTEDDSRINSPRLNFCSTSACGVKGDDQV